MRCKNQGKKKTGIEQKIEHKNHLLREIEKWKKIALECQNENNWGSFDERFTPEQTREPFSKAELIKEL